MPCVTGPHESTKMLLAGPSQSSAGSSWTAGLGSLSMGIKGLFYNATTPSASPKRSIFKSFTQNMDTEKFLQKLSFNRPFRDVQPPRKPTIVTTPRASSHDSDSVDSLKMEMCHFKPIRAWPTSPRRITAAGVIKVPGIIASPLAATTKGSFRAPTSRNGISAFLLKKHNSAFEPLKPVCVPLKRKHSTCRQSSPKIRRITRSQTREHEYDQEQDQNQEEEYQQQQQQQQSVIPVSPLLPPVIPQSRSQSLSQQSQQQQPEQEEPEQEQPHQTTVQTRKRRRNIEPQSTVADKVKKCVQQIEQEQSDLEYARSLQRQLDETQQSTTVRSFNTPYSLRSKIGKSTKAKPRTVVPAGVVDVPDANGAALNEQQQVQVRRSKRCVAKRQMTS